MPIELQRRRELDSKPKEAESAVKTNGHGSRRQRQPDWAALPEDDLLQVRLKDLRVSIGNTWLQECLDEVNAELDERSLKARAHGWVSDEWFSPHITPGIAFPFYLCHARLEQLERKMLLEVEGGTQRECMRILRHEAGHVVQYAYGLHRRRRWQTLFGRASRAYPDHYQPDPKSKNYVQHLRRWYAQCHPDEDFAETFAVWLTPRSNWRTRYADWPALEKLLYVDEVMAELAGVKPLPARRIEVDPIAKLNLTLGEHYELKRQRYAIDAPTIFDRDLRRIFLNGPHRAGAFASTFIRQNRAKILKSVVGESGEHPFAVDAALDDMIDRSRALKLRAAGSSKNLKQEITALLSTKSIQSFYSSARRQFAV